MSNQIHGQNYQQIPDAKFTYIVMTWLPKQNYHIDGDSAEFDGDTVAIFRRGVGKVATIHHVNSFEPRCRTTHTGETS